MITRDGVERGGSSCIVLITWVYAGVGVGGGRSGGLCG